MVFFQQFHVCLRNYLFEMNKSIGRSRNKQLYYIYLSAVRLNKKFPTDLTRQKKKKSIDVANVTMHSQIIF